jgi:hypothetical protein
MFQLSLGISDQALFSELIGILLSGVTLLAVFSPEVRCEYDAT